MRRILQFAISLLVVLPSILTVKAEPWDLSSYRLCKKLRLNGIQAEASGVTYNYITNTVWVVTRRPRVLAEYTVDGSLVRTIDTLNARLRDPEGVAWMYDYVFAISEEGGSPAGDDSSITIVEAAPWRSKVDVLKKIYIRNIRHDKNKGLEGLTWDPLNRILLAGQEFDPVQIWAIDPDSGKSQKVFNDAERTKKLRDFASVYKRPGDSGLYILSEPSKLVLKLDKDGDLVRGEDKEIEGPMPEGLTFTSDGHMMFIVSEPNLMFIYSSTGSCSYDKSSAPIWEASSDSDDDDDKNDSSEDLEEPLITDGYCSFDRCESGYAQGASWCRNNVHQCVGGCGGWWCSKVQGIPPVTKANYIAPPPPPSPPPQNSPPPPPNSPPPPPWYKQGDSTGFCAATGDCSLLHEDPWCRDSIVNCMKCAATWCPRRNVPDGAEPLDRNNYPDVLPGQPWYFLPSLGFCSSTSDCGTPHPDAWCAETALNCVKCASSWCPREGLKNKDPITFETYPNVPARRPPPAPPIPSPPPPSATHLSPDTISDPSLPEAIPDPTSAKSQTTTQELSTTQPQTEMTPLPTVSVWSESSQSQEGHKAIIILGMMGVAMLDSSQIRAMEQEIALQVFGAKDAEIRVSITPLSDASHVHHSSIIELEVAILTETDSHAKYIISKVGKAVASGVLLDALRFPGVAFVQMLDSQSVLAGILAKDLPKADPQNTMADQEPEEVIAYEVDDLGSSEASSKASKDGPTSVAIVGFGSGLAAACLVAAGMCAFVMCRKGNGTANVRCVINDSRGDGDYEEQSLPSSSSTLEMSSAGQEVKQPRPSTESHPIRLSIATDDQQQMMEIWQRQHQHAIAKIATKGHKRSGSMTSALLDFQSGFSSAESTPQHSRTCTMEDIPGDDLAAIAISVAEASDNGPSEAADCSKFSRPSTS